MRIGLVGLGEVGRVLAEDLRARGVKVAAWDVAFEDAGSVASRNAEELGLAPARDVADAVRGAEVVISAVTAANDVAAAEAAAPALEQGAFFLDMNSASPGSKRASAAAVERAGGRYVEAAVMSPIGAKRTAAPMLLGGPHAAEFLKAVEGLGFDGCRVYSDEVGKASATKMCRSVMVKGVEALVTESMLAARAWGVEGEVLASLSDLMPFGDWEKLAAYMMSRSLEHGRRRAEEMREVAKTVAETGVEPLMSTACAERQDWAAAFGDLADEDDLRAMVDGVRARLRSN